ncbi:hypothetical protein C3E98_027440 [Pseudomonas sp. MWU13-2625]|nr:hypothetical protein C3E98_027440 [Pseudomonas sp. MWU13-2625]
MPVRASSRASPLPQGSGVLLKFVYHTDHCGSGLAREEAKPDHTKPTDCSHSTTDTQPPPPSQ